MREISPYIAKYKLISPNGQIVAEYEGTEYGMGSPTLGNFKIYTDRGEKLYSFPGFAQSSFSDNSKYFIYQKPFGSGSSLVHQTAVIELTTGKEVWITERHIGEFSEAIASGMSLQVNKIDIQSLADEKLAFDISLCRLIE